MTKEVKTNESVRIIDDYDYYDMNIYYSIDEATEETRLTFMYDDSLGADITWAFNEPSCKSYRDILNEVIGYFEKQSTCDTDLYCSTFSNKNQFDKVLALLKKARNRE